MDKENPTYSSSQLTCLLSSIQVDIQIIKNDAAYTKAFIEGHNDKLKELENSVQEIEKHVAQVQGAVKFISILGTLLGIVLVIYKLSNT